VSGAAFVADCPTRRFLEGVAKPSHCSSAVTL
jgi:hypothetical protein